MVFHGREKLSLSGLKNAALKEFFAGSLSRRSQLVLAGIVKKKAGRMIMLKNIADIITNYTMIQQNIFAMTVLTRSIKSTLYSLLYRDSPSFNIKIFGR